jgi:hypothetical protein
LQVESRAADDLEHVGSGGLCCSIREVEEAGFRWR